MLTHKPLVSREAGSTYGRGMLMVALEDQPMSDEEILESLRAFAQKYQVVVHSLDSGSKLSGANPGSPGHDILKSLKSHYLLVLVSEAMMLVRSGICLIKDCTIPSL